VLSITTVLTMIDLLQCLSATLTKNLNSSYEYH
jgi:hypothetical protein